MSIGIIKTNNMIRLLSSHKTASFYNATVNFSLQHKLNASDIWWCDNTSQNFRLKFMPSCCNETRLRSEIWYIALTIWHAVQYRIWFLVWVETAFLCLKVYQALMAWPSDKSSFKMTLSMCHLLTDSDSERWQVTTKIIREKTSPSATHLTQTGPGMNLGLHSERLVTKWIWIVYSQFVHHREHTVL